MYQTWLCKVVARHFPYSNMKSAFFSHFLDENLQFVVIDFDLANESIEEKLLIFWGRGVDVSIGTEELIVVRLLQDRFADLVPLDFGQDGLPFQVEFLEALLEHVELRTAP